MPVSDAMVRSRIRGILGRHYVDQEQLRVIVARGTVRLSGTFARLAEGEETCLDPQLLQKVGQEIQSITGVKRLYLTEVRLEKKSKVDETSLDLDLDLDVETDPAG